jgi:hypothetical protein
MWTGRYPTSINIKATLAAAGLLASATRAQASIIPQGLSLTFGGANLPGGCTDTSCSDTVTFSSTPVSIDGGALSLFETQVATGPNGEWDVWHLSTTSGGSLAGDVNASWNIVMDYTLSAAVNFDQVVHNGLSMGRRSVRLPTALAAFAARQPRILFCRARPIIIPVSRCPCRLACGPTGNRFLSTPTALSPTAASTRTARTGSISRCTSRCKHQCRSPPPGR